MNGPVVIVADDEIGSRVRLVLAALGTTIVVAA